jgi:hypothetical protein
MQKIVFLNRLIKLLNNFIILLKKIYEFIKPFLFNEYT